MDIISELYFDIEDVLRRFNLCSSISVYTQGFGGTPDYPIVAKSYAKYIKKNGKPFFLKERTRMRWFK